MIVQLTKSCARESRHESPVTSTVLYLYLCSADHRRSSRGSSYMGTVHGAGARTASEGRIRGRREGGAGGGCGSGEIRPPSARSGEEPEQSGYALLRHRAVRRS